jgi:DNA-binding NarL/FixJ family response regulator
MDILLIEDEYIIAKDIKTLLAKNDFASVDVVKTYKAALELYIQKSYNIIISDINLNNGLDGIEIIEALTKIKKTPVVYLTAYSDKTIIDRASKTMPFAYILKPYNSNQLIATINLALLNFEKGINLSSNIENKDNTEKLNLLTNREKEVLIILSTGKLSKEVADLLSITTNTVEQHKKNIRKKLNLTTIGELINFTLSVKLLRL